jgi:hypothetical protein
LTIRSFEQRATVVLVVALALIVAIVLFCSRRWGVVHDTPIMHYVAWRIAEGDVPYRDIFDMNFPGTYLVHLAVLKLLGPGDLAWRCFDLLCLAAIAALIVAYCRPFGRWSAILGALAFAAFHLANGVYNLGQRDFLIVPLLLAASLAIVRFREHKPCITYLLLAGLAMGSTLTIKPHAALFVALIGAAAMLMANKSGYSLVRAFLAYVIAAAAPVVALGIWLWIIGALGPLLSIVFDYLLPLYTTLGKFGRNPMLLQRMSLVLLLSPLVLVSLWRIGFGDRGDFRRQLAALGLLCGVVYYVAQGKWWVYHLYPLACFACVTAFSFADRIRAEGGRAIRVVFLINLLLFTVGAGYVESRHMRLEHRPHRKKLRVNWLRRNLAPRLSPSDKIQVFDTTQGGLHLLWELRCRQPTRFIYDFPLLAHEADQAYVQQLRREFLDDLKADPPKFLVVFRRGWPDGGYRRLKRFGELSEWIRRHYEVEADADECRIYARRHR